MIVLGTGLTVSSGRRAPRPLSPPFPAARAAARGPGPPRPAAPPSARAGLPAGPASRTLSLCTRSLVVVGGLALQGVGAGGDECVPTSPGLRQCPAAGARGPKRESRDRRWKTQSSWKRTVFPLCSARGKPDWGSVLVHLLYGLLASPDWKRKSTRQSGGGRRPLLRFLLRLQPLLLIRLCLPELGRRFCDRSLDSHCFVLDTVRLT